MSAPDIYISVAQKPGNFGATVYNELFKRHKINAIYLPRIAPAAPELIPALRALGINGCSVSMPLKNQVLPLLDELDPLCAKLRSCNTITNRSGILKGFNTDYAGARAVIEKAGARSAIVYGTGAMVKVLLATLKDLALEQIYLAGRNHKSVTALSLATGFSVYDSSQGPVDLFINATPLSLEPLSPQVLEIAAAAKSIFDLVVSKSPLHLEEFAKKNEKVFFPGYEMSMVQLHEQFAIYFGFYPSMHEIREIIRTRYLSSQA